MDNKRACDWLGWLLLLATLALCWLALSGCARGWGNGPSSDPEQRRIDEKMRKARRDAEEKLRRLNPMGGG